MPSTYGGRSTLLFQGDPSFPSRCWLAMRLRLSWGHHIAYCGMGIRGLDLVLGWPSILGKILAVLGILVSGYGLLGLFREGWGKRHNLRGGGVLMLVGWAVLHNAAYMVALPTRGNAGRDQWDDCPGDRAFDHLRGKGNGKDCHCAVNGTGRGCSPRTGRPRDCEVKESRDEG